MLLQGMPAHYLAFSSYPLKLGDFALVHAGQGFGPCLDPVLWVSMEVVLAIKLVQEREATGRVKEIYEDIKATMRWSFVPETFQMIALDPEHLESYWANYRQAMGPGRLDLKTKKLIAYLVSVMNNCGV